MVIPQSTIIGFYIVAFGQILILTTALFLLRMRHSFAFSALLLGFSVYLIGSEFFANLSFTGLSSISFLKDLFDKSPRFIYFISAFLTALFAAPVSYLLLRVFRKGNWDLFDSMAAGLGYWIYKAVTESVTFVNNARIAETINKGQIEQFLSDEITQADLNEWVGFIQQTTLVESISQLIYFMTSLAMTTLLFMLVYHGMKRKRFIFVLLAMGIHFASLLLCFNSYSSAPWFYCSVFALVCAALTLGIFLYLRWYRQQKADLLRRRKEFKDRRHAEYLAKVAAKEAAAEAAKKAAAEKKAISAQPSDTDQV